MSERSSVHLAEGVLPLAQAFAWTAAAAPAVAWSIRGERRSRADCESTSVVMAGATSLLFAATLFPLPVPVVGVTSHICLTPVLALIVGVRRMVWPTFFVLVLQAIFFAHGGITTLGINTLTLGLIGPMVTTGLWTWLWAGLRGGIRVPGFGTLIGLGIACGVGDLAVYVADALVLGGALSDLAAPSTTIAAMLIGFAPVQFPLAVLEALVSVAIVRLLASRRPDLLPESLRRLGEVSVRGTSGIVLFVGLCLGGCGYDGLDAAVFGAVASAAGRAPTDSILDGSGGEFGLAMWILVLFGFGFWGGRSWERLFGGRDDAVSR